MTKLIPILSGRCLVVELPEGATDYHVCNADGHESFSCFFIRTHTVDLPPGNWRIIGMLSEVTNAELADVTGFYYNKYNERYVEMPTSAMRATPIGDIEDAIKAEGYYLDENPLGNRPEMVASTDDDLDDFDFPNERGRKKWEEWEDEYRKWNDAQSRVLDRSRCLLLGREA